MKNFFKKKYFLIISLFLIAFVLAFKVPLKFFNNKNCNIKEVNKVPSDSIVVIGHLYGSPNNHNNFIDKKANQFLLKNQKKIRKLYLTGDVFNTPSKEKWEKLYKLLGNKMTIIVAPGNHDIGSESSLEIFNLYTNQKKDFPIVNLEGNNVFIVENSISSGWFFQENTLKEIKKIDKNNNLFLLRHNIAARELIKFANSEAFLERELPNLKEINNLLRRDMTIISGDGGAFKKLPRFYCREFGNIKYIINGLGGLRGDTILIINKSNIFRFILN